jgi:hypothetical protein
VSDFGFVAGITGLFFLFGIVFGVLAVIATSVLRGGAARPKRNRAGRLHDDTGHGADWPAGGWTDSTETGWEEPPNSGTGGAGNSPPRWPGGPSDRQA